MKMILLLILITVTVGIEAQQILSNSFYAKKPAAQSKSTTSFTPPDTINFKVFGVGNISNESLKAINAGGKVAFGFYPNPFKENWQGNYFVSYNKNATNTDSALSTTLIFPEAGNQSFLMNAFWKSPFNKRNTDSYKGLFLEFAVKKITNIKDTSDPKSQEFRFNTLHYTAGYKLGFSKERMKDDKKQNIGCELAAFFSYVNIPNEDHESFEKIINRTATKNDFSMIGFKVSFEVNGLQIFADLRHVFGSEEKLPVQDLKGFSYNIGFSFNTEVFRF